MQAVRFPEVDGRRSTTATGRVVLADAARAADTALAARIESVEHWRRGYLVPARELTAAAARAPQAALDIARAGLESLRARLAIGERPLAEAFAGPQPDPPPTAIVRGEAAPVRELVVPVDGEHLRGDALRRRLEAWTVRGVIEPSCAEAVRTVIDNPDWLSLADRRVALIGAGAEIGPLAPLTAWGAEVLAVDVPGRPVWERILATVRGGAGTVHVPLAGTRDAQLADAAGLDLLAGLPTLRAWLAHSTADAPLLLGMYVYDDGGRHVLASAAFDALAADLMAAREDVALAFLATPTDSFLVPSDVVEAARARWRGRGRRALLQAPLRRLSRERLLAPAYGELLAGRDGRTWGLADALVPQQGPNYMLAKRVQRWRGVLSRGDGRSVSFNVAPSSWTRSVTRNRVLSAAYAGAGRFGVEIFHPQTTSALMAALLVHDLHRPDADRRVAAPPHPEDLFVAGAAHGGLWRTPYAPRSALTLAALAGLPRSLAPGRR